jgi:hypothetical protein
MEDSESENQTPSVLTPHSHPCRLMHISSLPTLSNYYLVVASLADYPVDEALDGRFNADRKKNPDKHDDQAKDHECTPVHEHVQP